MLLSRSLSSPLASILLAVLVASTSACTSMWKRVAESDREFSIENARTYAQRGDCVKTLEALDRAEAKLEIGAYALEATRMRIACYKKLERHAAARAHQRLLSDFYETQNPAYPTMKGHEVFRVSRIPKVEFEPPPSALKRVSPEYSEYARRAYIVGRVVVSFELDSKDKAKAIRVLEMPHPLLATWAIEAIAQTQRDILKKDAVIQPGGRYLTTFVFEYRFANAGRSVDSKPEEFR